VHAARRPPRVPSLVSVLAGRVRRKEDDAQKGKRAKTQPGIEPETFDFRAELHYRSANISKLKNKTRKFDYEGENHLLSRRGTRHYSRSEAGDARRSRGCHAACTTHTSPVLVAACTSRPPRGSLRARVSARAGRAGAPTASPSGFSSVARHPRGRPAPLH
jgi:hypothetical protein